jgi:tetratricopeptide (TPR) repeat protein
MAKFVENEGGGPDALQARLERAQALMAVGRWREALGQLHAALSDDPENYWALTMLVLCHRRLRQFDEAFKAARRAIAAEPDSPEAFFQLSMAHLNKGRPATAMKFAQKALELAPEWNYSWRAVALCHLRLKDWRQAIAHAHEDLKRAEDPAAPLIHISTAYDGLGDPEGAEAWVRRALEADPTNADALNNLALILKKQGRWQESLDLFGGAVALAPANEALQDNFVGASLDYIDHSSTHDKADGTPMTEEERARANERFGCAIIFGGLGAVVASVVFASSLVGAVLLLVALLLFVGLPLLVLYLCWERRRAEKRLPAQARRALHLARRRRAESRRRAA